MILSDNTISELQWWVNNIEQSCRYITITKPDLTIYTDASLTEWGVTDKVNPSGGFWYSEEITHINVLKLTAIVKTRFSNMSRLCVIKTTAISCINHLGDQKSDDCN